jgi:hypothetical protein
MDGAPQVLVLATPRSEFWGWINQSILSVVGEALESSPTGLCWGGH